MNAREPQTIYITLADAIAIHEAIVLRTNARHEQLRDEGLLESALTRPRMAAHYEGADLVRQAALLATGISPARAFVDGNKRAAFAIAEVFLLLNGLRVTGDPIEMARQLVDVASRPNDLNTATERFEGWLRANTRHVEG